MRSLTIATTSFFLGGFCAWYVLVPSGHTGGYWTHGIRQPSDSKWSPSYWCTPVGVVGFSNMRVDPHPWPQKPFTVRRITAYDRQPGHSAVMQGESWIATDDWHEKGFVTGIQDFDGSKLILDDGGTIHIIVDLKTSHFIRAEIGIRAVNGYIDSFEVSNPTFSIGTCIQSQSP